MTYPPQQSGPGWPDQYGPDDPQQITHYEVQPYEPATDQGYGQPGYGQPGYILDYGRDPGHGQSSPQYSGPPQPGQQHPAPPQPGGPRYAPPQSGPPAYPVGGGFAPSPARPRSPLPFVLGGVALVVVLAAAVTVVIFATRADPKRPAANPGASAGPTGTPTPSTSPSASVGPDANGLYGDKIIDKATGLSFTRIDKSEWKVGLPTGATAVELDDPVGQAVALGSGSYSVVEIGQLNDEFGYTGPGDLKKVKSALATSILKNYYSTSGATTDKKIQDKALTQYGHKSWLWAYHIHYDGTGETVVIVILDAGGGKVGAFWGSVPDGHSGQLKAMKHAAGTLNFQS